MEDKSKLINEYIDWLETERKNLKQEVKELKGSMSDMETIINEQRS